MMKSDKHVLEGSIFIVLICMRKLLKSSDLCECWCHWVDMITFRFLALFLGYNLCFSESKPIFPSCVGCALQTFCQIQWHAHFQHDLTAGKPLLISQAVTSALLPRLKCGTNRQQQMSCKLEDILFKELRTSTEREMTRKQKAVCMCATCTCLIFIHLCMCTCVHYWGQEVTFSRWCVSPVMFSMWFPGQAC